MGVVMSSFCVQDTERRCSAVAPDFTTPVLPTIEFTDEEKNSLMTHYNQTLLEQRSDAFHRVMLQCINSSPKINELIACQMYCYRDLSKWPKLDRLSQAQLVFYDKLIYQMKLDSVAISEAVYSLGVIHHGFARYGMKPHFLDLWQRHFSDILIKLKFGNEDDKDLFIKSFEKLNKYVTEVMNVAYCRCQQLSTREEKELIEKVIDL